MYVDCSPCRVQVYLPMSYVWGMRGTCKRTPLTAAIQEELYPQPYGSIDWDAARNQCAKQDLYYPHPKIQVHAAPPASIRSTSFLSGLPSWWLTCFDKCCLSADV